MLNENTPIEKYVVDGKEIYVKREDLFGTYPAPPLAKLRGARIVLKRLKEKGITKIAVFDTRISKAGQGIAYLCKDMNLECLAGFPKLKNKKWQKVIRCRNAWCQVAAYGSWQDCYMLCSIQKTCD
jgi:threonine dehydratase